MSLKSINKTGNRLEKLKELARVLAKEIDANIEPKALPQLAKQYRETLCEIEEIEGADNNGDEIAEILSERGAAGKAGAVR